MSKLLSILVFLISKHLIKGDPCTSYNILDSENDFIRSAANKDGSLCDNMLVAGWYQISSKAGERMPTECIYGGFRCGTTFPIWMNVSKGEYPATGEVKNVTACAASYTGDCCAYSYDIQVKNCTNYLVYNLKPVTTCFQAYCFGSELPCPQGETSDNGFSPGCKFDPCHSSNYKVLSGEIKRSSNYTLQTDDNSIDDSRLRTGWYRIDSVTGNDIVNQSVPMMQCGTLFPLWMQGNIPLVEDKTVDRKVCRSGVISTCDSEHHIKVRNCGTYRTYYLGQLGDAQSAYCFGTLPVPKTTTTTTITTPVEGEEKMPYIWIIVGSLAVLSTGLLIYVIHQVCKKRNNAKRAVSCVSMSKPPSYDEAMQNEINLQKVVKIGHLEVNAGVTLIETMTCPQNSTYYQQFKRTT